MCKHLECVRVCVCVCVYVYVCVFVCACVQADMHGCKGRSVQKK